MNILVINCGSSSLKYQLISMENEKVLAKGLVERIGIEGSNLVQKVEGRDKYIITKPMNNHTEAVKLVLDSLIDKEHGVISSMDEISAVGHRVVHGGENYSKSVLINDDVLKSIEECSKLAPLHNPANIIGINACKDLMPSVPMVAVFDTAFHQTMPDYAFMYALPYELYSKYSIRKYGFHGTSHRYVSKEAAKMLNKDISELKIITCHIGNGCSVTAVENGKCVDTSMGFTPLEGVAMGTRSGNIDPAVVTYLIKEAKLSVDEVENLLNKKSGVYGISGVSSDFRDIKKAAFQEGNKRAELAVKLFNYRIKQYIGSYAAAMGGVDCIVFTAGIGENSAVTREGICEGLEFLGAELDKVKNDAATDAEDISVEGSKVKILVIPTDEELMIARDTKEITLA